MFIHNTVYVYILQIVIYQSSAKKPGDVQGPTMLMPPQPLVDKWQTLRICRCKHMTALPPLMLTPSWPKTFKNPCKENLEDNFGMIFHDFPIWDVSQIKHPKSTPNGMIFPILAIIQGELLEIELLLASNARSEFFQKLHRCDVVFWTSADQPRYQRLGRLRNPTFASKLFVITADLGCIKHSFSTLSFHWT